MNREKKYTIIEEMDTLLCNDDGDIVLSVYDGLLTESSTSTTVSSADQVLNVYGEITSASVSSGATSFTVDDASLFGVGDDILIYQVQNGTSTTVGYYEYRTISGVNTGSNTITVSQGLTNAYVSSTKNASPSYSAQIVRVQVYDTLTVNSGASITCDAWNGKKGGIVAIKCNTVAGSGTIHTNYKGFRGGHYGTWNENPGYVGEGIYGGGSTTLVSGRVTGVTQRTPLGGMNTGGSGGEGASHAGSGGGGGGHVNAGTEGRCRHAGHENPGGYAAPITISQIFFGGGGGGGGDDDALASDSWGGHGGGIVILLCNNVASTINLESKGENHSSNNATQAAAKGSGGAGGTILLTAAPSATTDVSGGLGYVNTNEGLTAYGGDGSVGILSSPQSDVISTKNIVMRNLAVLLDASDIDSYSGSGTAWSDISGNGRNATLQGTVPWVSNGSASYFDFSGNNADYINQTAGTSQIYKDICIVFQYEDSGWKYLLSKSTTADRSLRINGNRISNAGNTGDWVDTTPGAISYYVNGAADTDQVDLSQNQWYILGGENTNDTLLGSAWNYYIGTGRTQSSRNLNGKIAFLALYTEPLTATEHIENYNALKHRFGV